MLVFYSCQITVVFDICFPFYLLTPCFRVLSASLNRELSLNRPMWSNYCKYLLRRIRITLRTCPLNLTLIFYLNFELFNEKQRGKQRKSFSCADNKDCIA